jgi:hypothetical protein
VRGDGSVVLRQYQSPPRYRDAEISESCFDRARIVFDSPAIDGLVPGFDESILGFTHWLTDTSRVKDGDIVPEPRTVKHGLLVSMPEQDILVVGGIESSRDAGKLTFADAGVPVPGCETDSRF